MQGFPEVDGGGIQGEAASDGFGGAAEVELNGRAAKIAVEKA